MVWLQRATMSYMQEVKNKRVDKRPQWALSFECRQGYVDRRRTVKARPRGADQRYPSQQTRTAAPRDSCNRKKLSCRKESEGIYLELWSAGRPRPGRHWRSERDRSTERRGRTSREGLLGCDCGREDERGESRGREDSEHLVEERRTSRIGGRHGLLLSTDWAGRRQMPGALGGPKGTDGGTATAGRILKGNSGQTTSVKQESKQDVEGGEESQTRGELSTAQPKRRFILLPPLTIAPGLGSASLYSILLHSSVLTTFVVARPGTTLSSRFFTSFLSHDHEQSISTSATNPPGATSQAPENVI